MNEEALRRRAYGDAMRALATDSQRALMASMLAIGAGSALERIASVERADMQMPIAEAARADAQTLAIAARQLEYVITEIYEEQFPELPVAEGLIIDIDSSIPEGAETFIWYAYSGRAMARFTAPYGTGEAPRATIKGASRPGRVQGLENSYGFHVREQRAAAYAGIPLEAMLGKAVRRGMAEKHQAVALFGREDLGLPGLLTHPNITVIDAPADGTASSRSWSAKTVDQIARDFSTLVRTVERVSYGQRKTTNVLLPRDTATLIETTRLGVGDGPTFIKDLLTRAHPGITITTLNEMQASNSDGVFSTDVALAYVKSRDILRLVIPMPFRQHPPQLHNLETVVPCESSIGGVILTEPQTVVRMDGVGAS